MVIERAFALLKGRFRRFKYLDLDIVADMSNFVMACCTLHNICLTAEEEIEDMISEGHDVTEVCPRAQCVHDMEGQRIHAATKHDELMEYLWDN